MEADVCPYEMVFLHFFAVLFASQQLLKSIFYLSYFSVCLYCLWVSVGMHLYITSASLLGTPVQLLVNINIK